MPVTPWLIGCLILFCFTGVLMATQWDDAEEGERVLWIGAAVATGIPLLHWLIVGLFL